MHLETPWLKNFRWLLYEGRKAKYMSWSAVRSAWRYVRVAAETHEVAAWGSFSWHRTQCNYQRGFSSEYLNAARLLLHCFRTWITSDLCAFYLHCNMDNKRHEVYYESTDAFMSLARSTKREKIFTTIWPLCRPTDVPRVHGCHGWQTLT